MLKFEIEIIENNISLACEVGINEMNFFLAFQDDTKNESNLSFSCILDVYIDSVD